jgi:hypothetical protein
MRIKTILPSIGTIKQLLFLFFLLMFFAGCEIDDDENFTLPRDKYIGQWLCEESGGAAYRTTITSDPNNSTQVIIHNFFNLSGNVTAIVTNESVTVQNQKMLNILGSYWCEGFGRYTHKNGAASINWSKYAANNEELTAIYIKQ